MKEFCLDEMSFVQIYCLRFENELFFHVQFLVFRTGGVSAAGAPILPWVLCIPTRSSRGRGLPPSLVTHKHLEGEADTEDG